MLHKIIFLCVLILIIPFAFGQTLLQDYIYEGETRIFQVGQSTYEFKVVTISDSQEKAIFSVNGERSKALRENERDTLSDGSRIYVSNILIDEDGKDLVEVYFSVTGQRTYSESIITEEIDVDDLYGRIVDMFSYFFLE